MHWFLHPETTHHSMTLAVEREVKQKNKYKSRQITRLQLFKCYGYFTPPCDVFYNLKDNVKASENKHK